jgi:CelD/BcsL family acetyltransferase involved in cellulose biosynthesis
LRIVIARAIPEDRSLLARWNEIAEQAERSEIFFTHQWSAAVASSYQEKLEPLFALGYNGETLQGVAALAVDSSKGIAQFLNANTADYCDFLSCTKSRPEFIASVLSELSKIQVKKLVLANIPKDSSTCSAVSAVARDLGLHVLMRPAYDCAQVQLGSPTQRQQYQATLYRRKMVRRYLRTLEKLGAVTVRHLTQWSDVESALPVFAQMQVARFLATGRVSNLVHADRREFLRNLAKRLTDAGWLSLSVLSVGDRPIAWNYGFRFHGSWFWYQPTIDTEFEQQSPGFCLLSKILEEACQSPSIFRVDLGLGSEEYKLRVSNDVRQTVHLTISDSLAVKTKDTLRFYSAHFVKKSPVVERNIRSLLGRVGSLRRDMRASGTLALLRSSSKMVRTGLRLEREDLYEVSQCDVAAIDFDTVRVTTADLNMLAQTAMEYSDDEETLSGLVRGARWLREGMIGVAVVNSNHHPLSLCWFAPIPKYLKESELKQIRATGGADLLFDCWAAPRLSEQKPSRHPVKITLQDRLRSGFKIWILGSILNTSSGHILSECGLHKRLSIVQNRQFR